MEAKELIKRVRKIEIKSRGLSHDIFAGYYHSAFKGRGMAFSEVREYQPGDDIRSIDWNVTARFNHPYVKVFEEERELTVMLLIDVSGSREFGTTGMLKKNLMTEIAAVLSFSAIQNNDKIGVIFFSDMVEKFIPPKKGRKHILHIIRELIDFTPKSSKTDLSESLRFLTNAIKKRSTAFLISDFLQPGIYSESYGNNLQDTGSEPEGSRGNRKLSGLEDFSGNRLSGSGSFPEGSSGNRKLSGLEDFSGNRLSGSGSFPEGSRGNRKLSGLEETIKIAARKHDLVAIRIYDQRETELPPAGMIRVMDAETGEMRWVDSLSGRVRDSYAQWWKNHDKTLREIFMRNGIDSVSVNTGEDYVLPLIRLFKRRG